MGIVVAEVDIARDGTITVTPNPVPVPSGDTVIFHVRSNASEGTRFTATFPGGPDSPFGEQDAQVTVNAIRCQGPGNSVNWPPGVDRATVTLRVHGSHTIGKIEVPVVRAEPEVVCPPQGHGFPWIVHNYNFGTPGDGGIPVGFGTPFLPGPAHLSKTLEHCKSQEIHDAPSAGDKEVSITVRSLPAGATVTVFSGNGVDQAPPRTHGGKTWTPSEIGQGKWVTQKKDEKLLMHISLRRNRGRGTVQYEFNGVTAS